MEEDSSADIYSRPRCTCLENQDDIDKSFAYIETSLQNKTIAENDEELHENVWFDVKPPKGLAKEPPPRITARQIEISRIKIEGKKQKDEDKDQAPKKPPSDANIVSTSKKKAAVDFLSVTSIEEEDD